MKCKNEKCPRPIEFTCKTLCITELKRQITQLEAEKELLKQNKSITEIRYNKISHLVSKFMGWANFQHYCENAYLYIERLEAEKVAMREMIGRIKNCENCEHSHINDPEGDFDLSACLCESPCENWKIKGDSL